ncbi:MAG TPA: allophanate hydrolase subunit 1 [Gemmataceae bacterium]|nr:allophanate hydrolase subunit 1 [Gemmataceae bacterium]
MQSIMPLGDQAALAYFADEAGALHFAAVVRGENPAWLVDVVQAYASVAVFFDLDHSSYAEVAATMRRLDERRGEPTKSPEIRLLHIPCCYELQLDLARVAEHAGLTVEEIIRLHASIEYTVYAIGFCPGFPYLGYLPPPLCGVPRLDQPRVRVAAGSVGLTGKQTGIYTEERPGGWNIVGRTPLELVNVAEGYFPLRVGDRVKFERIDESEYQRRQGSRL